MFLIISDALVALKFESSELPKKATLTDFVSTRAELLPTGGQPGMATGRLPAGQGRRVLPQAFLFATTYCWPQMPLSVIPLVLQDAVTVLLARTTAQLQAVERELAEERVKLEYTEEEILEMERKEEQAEAVSER